MKEAEKNSDADPEILALSNVREEYRKHGRISQISKGVVREVLRSGVAKFEAISLVADCALREAAAEVMALAILHSDAMVRWNAVGTLLTRLRDPMFASLALDRWRTDPAANVREIALVGMGEILPFVADPLLWRTLGGELWTAFHDNPDDMRLAAYDGILAALDVLPLDRPDPSLSADQVDYDAVALRRFSREYLGEDPPPRNE